MPRDTETFSARWSADLLARLKRLSELSGANRSRLAERLVDEGIRMEEHPGIVFRDGPAGRRASLEGRLDVWEVVMTLGTNELHGKEPVPWLAELLDLDERRVRVALRYYRAYPAEIDAWVKANTEGSEAAEAAWLREQDLLREASSR